MSRLARIAAWTFRDGFSLAVIKIFVIITCLLAFAGLVNLLISRP